LPLAWSLSLVSCRSVTIHPSDPSDLSDLSDLSDPSDPSDLPDPAEALPEHD
jgi:hypothetical protein